MERVTIDGNLKVIEEISWQISKSKRILVVTGAGISTSSGIPDFRSKNGLYELIKQKYPKENIKGEQLFDKLSLKNEKMTKIFYSFMGELRAAINSAVPTKAHNFFKRLAEGRKLLRYYTQNIDNLEAEIGLDAIQLHGSMAEVFCDSCRFTSEFTEEYIKIYKDGQAPLCPNCEIRESHRISLGKRGHKIGVLRPNITLYNDDDITRGLHIQQCVASDLKKKPDFLLVVGTSLKVYGLKRMIKDMAKSVHQRGGKAVLLNLSNVGKEWNHVFDYQIVAEADAWASKIEKHLGMDKQQIELDFNATKNAQCTKKTTTKRWCDQDEENKEKGIKKPRKTRIPLAETHSNY